MVDLSLPDITPDLDRVGTNPPTNEPSEPPSPSPTTPSPTTPRPTTQNPTPQPSPSPTTPPTTQNPTPAPSPSPTTSAPSPNPSLAPVAATPAPIAPTPSPSEEATTSWPPTYSNNRNPPAVRTYYSCPPPSSKTVEARDENGSDVLIEIPPPISTVRIAYDFQVQLLIVEDYQDSYITESLLPAMDNRLEESLGGYYKDGTEDGQDESRCGGYYVEDFRRRRKLNEKMEHGGIGTVILSMEQQQRRVEEAEEIPTKIIGISSAQDLVVDENQSCVPQNDNCYVVRGALDATYVGFNEAGVKSSISRAIRNTTVDNDSDNNEIYDIQYLGSATTQFTPSSLNNLGRWAEVLPASSGDSRLTPYGIGIMAALGSAFLMICYVLFIKNDGAGNLKDTMDERKEKKDGKKKALGEDDDEKQTDDQSYCYDLESVAIDCYGEDGFEVQSTQSSSSNCSNARSRDSGKTKRMSNRASDMNYDNAHKLSSLLEDVDEEYTTVSRVRGPMAVTPADAGCSVRSGRVTPLGNYYSNDVGTQAGTPLVDRIPSSARGSPISMEDVSSPPISPIHQLPSISEAELPPPMNDTPRLAYSHSRRGNRPDAQSSCDETEEWEV
eukprot:CAMPEP_0172300262 /NCGR_PEP_ID=MMETSP1058-20130122/2384_1 /TAXON_ID=83371 /ORGANISM="Detonula confervacea, Strain CCMP 353" /LENGTH=609 /DNA_ID=CAMNT_0013009989 /DNA_START=304 /DNA_END=2133 /DNA_ORIENTATION=-